MRSLLYLIFIAVLTLPAVSQPQYLDLSQSLDAEVVTSVLGSSLTPFLDEEDGSLYEGSLPGSYLDGQATTTMDGRTSFMFAPLLTEALDAMTVNGQVLDVEDGLFSSIDLAYLSAPGSYGNPFSMINFIYADGTTETQRFAPVAGWQTSPSAYDNVFLSYTDDSAVEVIEQFDTLSDDEVLFMLQDRGSNSDGSARFIDGTGFALYVFDVAADLQSAKLGVTVGNNFEISIATSYMDPEASTTEGYTIIANSMDIYDGFEHRALGNLKFYEFDLTQFLAEGTQEIFVLFTDATPADGWGPYVRNLQIFTGDVQEFEETFMVEVAPVGDSEIYAQFQTDGNETEAEYLYDNSASGPSSRGHRFADGNGFLTYHFDFADDVNEAKVTVDMANNFIVGLSGPTDQIRYEQVTPGSPQENDFLFENSANLSGNHRFADGGASMTYRFDLANDLTAAYALVNVGNQFIVEIAGADENFDIAQDWVGDTGEEPRDNSNLAVYSYNLASYLSGNAENVIYLRFSDGQPADGWGADLYGISIVNQENSGDAEFETVLDAMEMFGEDIHNEYNKAYYTIDLTSALANNPGKEVFVRFTDASSGDGWGPGIFWMAAYSGEIDIQSDSNVFDGLKSTAGVPANINAGLNYRRFALNASKALSEIQLPAITPNEDATVYVLGATLNSAGSDVSHWSMY
ncbi:MAG: hypothetical protein P9L94_04695 [Candidatus Hinthialibacter antarcticus]|nr:hypothetical protein [Candidatus Hinthialibacter antarcticus]